MSEDSERMIQAAQPMIDALNAMPIAEAMSVCSMIVGRQMARTEFDTHHLADIVVQHARQLPKYVHFYRDQRR